MQRHTSPTTKRVRRKPIAPKVAKAPIAPSASHEAWLIEHLKDPAEAALYLEAAIEDGDQGVLMLALRRVAQAHGGVAAGRDVGAACGEEGGVT